MAKQRKDWQPKSLQGRHGNELIGWLCVIPFLIQGRKLRSVKTKAHTQNPTTGKHSRLRSIPLVINEPFMKTVPNSEQSAKYTFAESEGH